jgi:hypothetical protein
MMFILVWVRRRMASISNKYKGLTDLKVEVVTVPNALMVDDRKVNDSEVEIDTLPTALLVDDTNCNDIKVERSLMADNLVKMFSYIGIEAGKFHAAEKVTIVNTWRRTINNSFANLLVEDYSALRLIIGIYVKSITDYGPEIYKYKRRHVLFDQSMQIYKTTRFHL